MTTDKPRPELILASGSPRRRELLDQAGYPFEVVVPAETAEQGICSNCGPLEFVATSALRKAQDVAARVSAGLLLACDTVAECDGQILGKPANEDHARQMLCLLRGRAHRVYSGVCVWQIPDKEPALRCAVTSLHMDQLSDDQIEEYLSTGQWQGKAGGFGFQDQLGWVHIVEGSESNVVGLPMELVAEMLADVQA